MSPLHSIVYVSSAVHLPNQQELEHLLVHARERNARHNVTGLLLYCDGSFMQYIEGPRADLLEIYQIIRNDPLHHNLIELVNEAITQREFDGWSMAFCHRPNPALPTTADDETQPEIAFVHEALETLSPAKTLLRSFWLNFHKRPVSYQALS